METEEAKPFSQSSIYRFLNHSAERIRIKEVAEEIVSQMYKLGQINSVYAIGNDFIY